jgi:PTS system nitrogen regulatory IIA component
MNRLASILSAQDIRVGLVVSSKKQLFEEAGALFEANHGVASAAVTENLRARERLGSTALGHGVAIPHGRIRGLKTPVAAVLRLRQAIDFDGPDDEGVTLLVVLFVPEAATQRHLEILSEVAEMLADKELRERLQQSVDAGSVLALIAAWRPPGAISRPVAVRSIAG